MPALPFLVVLLASCAHAPEPAPALPQPPASVQAAPAWPACQPISEQERWGFVVEDPAASGFTLAMRSDHFLIWTAPGAEAIALHVETGEAHVALMEALLERDYQGPAVFLVHPSNEAAQEAVGSNVLIRRDAQQLQLASSRHLHEVVHLMTYQLAGHRAPPLFEEGIAEGWGNWGWGAGDPPEELAIRDWTGEHVHTMTARWLAEGTLPPLSGLVTDRQCRTYHGPLTGNTYVFAASFARWLADERGGPQFMALLQLACVEDLQSVVLDKYQRIYGEELPAADQRWRLWLARSEAEAARQRGEAAVAGKLEALLETR